MKLSCSERENLLGPMFMGILIGLVCAFATASRYDGQYEAIDVAGRPLHEILLAFFLGFNVAFIPFGVVPVLIARVMAKVQDDGGPGPSSP